MDESNCLSWQNTYVAWRHKTRHSHSHHSVKTSISFIEISKICLLKFCEQTKFYVGRNQWISPVIIKSAQRPSSFSKWESSNLYFRSTDTWTRTRTQSHAHVGLWAVRFRASKLQHISVPSYIYTCISFSDGQLAASLRSLPPPRSGTGNKSH
jgi:hypothetical protein